jgi:hypothetical protein
LNSKKQKSLTNRLSDSLKSRVKTFTIRKIKTTIRYSAIKSGQILSALISRKKPTLKYKKQKYTSTTKREPTPKFIRHGKAKFVSDKNTNKKTIIRLYKADTIPDSRLFERKVKPKIKGLPYRTKLMIDFEILNYYHVKKKGDLPVLERKQYYVNYRGIKDMYGVKQDLINIIKGLKDSVDYRMDKNKFIKDVKGKPIPTNLQFVRVMRVVRWDSAYKPKELRVEKHERSKVKFNIPKFKRSKKQLYP